MEIHRLGPVWVLVAHDSGARIFGRLNHQKPTELLETIFHPIGRAKTNELVSDRAGRDEEWGPSAGRHSMGEKKSPTEKNAADFAKMLADALALARDMNRFEYLILVAAPKFLGLLRKNLSPGIESCVVDSVAQNLGYMEDRETAASIEPLIDRFYKSAGLKRVS